jgi:hypothetical protein
MEEFFTRETANKGITLPLYTPDGEKSEHSLTILGVDSDAHYKAELNEKRKIMSLQAQVQNLSPEKRDELVAEMQQACEIEIFAALIGDWTFKQKCSHANKVKFLTNAPQFTTLIDKIASDRKRFFVKGQSNLKDSQ